MAERQRRGPERSVSGPSGAARDLVSDRRFTFVIVPEGGRGRVWQLSVPLRWLRTGVGVVATLLAVVIGVTATGAAVLPRIEDHDAIIGENLALRTRLEAAEAELQDVAALVQRVRVYDEKLREMAQRQQLPGFGPLDPEELSEREAWINKVARVPPRDVPPDVALRAANLETMAANVADELFALEGRLDGMADVLVQATAASSVLPVTAPVADMTQSSAWGWRRSPFGRGWKFHAGLDIEGDSGDMIYAVNTGLVVFAGWYGGYGNVIDIDHGQGVVTRYGHARRLLVTEGDTVDVGQEIAEIGSTGWSTGPHLHFELRIDGESVDPTEYLP